MTAASTCWTISKDVALLECGQLQAKVLLDHVGRGLKCVTWKLPGKKRKETALCPLLIACGSDHPGCRRTETYVRGNDLVSNYESDSPLGTPQIYWRVRQDTSRSAVGIELILSKHTPLLESDPESAVDCLGGSLWHAPSLDADAFVSVSSQETPIKMGSASSQTHLFLYRNEHPGISYLQFVYPSDFASAELTNQLAEFQGEAWYVRALLFPENLEKGVIRRARVCGWFLPAENDLQVAVELARQFVDEPLPLTT